MTSATRSSRLDVLRSSRPTFSCTDESPPSFGWLPQIEDHVVPDNVFFSLVALLLLEGFLHFVQENHVLNSMKPTSRTALLDRLEHLTVRVVELNC